MIETRIQGIPCLVEMTAGTYLQPWAGGMYTAPSDVDYYGGWQDIDFKVYDRKGYPAPWLEKKMTPADESRILQELAEYAEP